MSRTGFETSALPFDAPTDPTIETPLPRIYRANEDPLAYDTTFSTDQVELDDRGRAVTRVPIIEDDLVFHIEVPLRAGSVIEDPKSGRREWVDREGRTHPLNKHQRNLPNDVLKLRQQVAELEAARNQPAQAPQVSPYATYKEPLGGYHGRHIAKESLISRIGSSKIGSAVVGLSRLVSTATKQAVSAVNPRPYLYNSRHKPVVRAMSTELVGPVHRNYDTSSEAIRHTLTNALAEQGIPSILDFIEGGSQEENRADYARRLNRAWRNIGTEIHRQAEAGNPQAAAVFQQLTTYRNHLRHQIGADRQEFREPTSQD